jgi:hypothetical protein
MMDFGDYFYVCIPWRINEVVVACQNLQILKSLEPVEPGAVSVLTFLSNQTTTLCNTCKQRPKCILIRS